MADDQTPTPELVLDVERALAGINFADDATLFHTMEALHELSHVLGNLYHAEVQTFLDRLTETPDDDTGTIRELVAEWDGEMRLRFVAWMRGHDVPFLRWWVLHSTGVWLLWEIHAH